MKNINLNLSCMVLSKQMFGVVLLNLIIQTRLPDYNYNSLLWKAFQCNVYFASVYYL